MKKDALFFIPVKGFFFGGNMFAKNKGCFLKTYLGHKYSRLIARQE